MTTSIKSLAKSATGTLRRSLNGNNAAVVMPPETNSGARYVSNWTNLNQMWPHAPESLLHARVEYQVKFLGKTEVAQRTGVEVMREALLKLQFRLEQNRATVGSAASKLTRVLLQINTEEVKIIDKNSGQVIDKYPLYRISFVAGDKQDKRVFSFIAKRQSEDRHDCFVFMSERLCSEITQTLGEAFDLAYKKFVNNSGGSLTRERHVKALEVWNIRLTSVTRAHENTEMQIRVKELEAENGKLRRLLAATHNNESTTTTEDARMSALVQSTTSTLSLAPRHAAPAMPVSPTVPHVWESFESTSFTPPALPTSPCPKAPPPRLHSAQTSSSSVIDNSFDPRAPDKPKDEFDQDPFNDEFFTNMPSSEQLKNEMHVIDREMADMREGFAAGALNIVHTDELGVAALNISELLSQSANSGSAAAVGSSAASP